MAGVYLPELKLQKGVPMTVHIWPNGKFHAVVDDVLTCMGTTVQLPPHGRLIDADALISTVRRIYQADGTFVGEFPFVTSYEIIEADTILSADPAEEE